MDYHSHSLVADEGEHYHCRSTDEVHDNGKDEDKVNTNNRSI